MTPINQLEQTISTYAIKVWRIQNSITHGLITLFIIGLLGASLYLNWYPWVMTTLIILLVCDILFALWSILAEPILLQRYWRYAISHDEVQIRHGILNIEQTIVPMTKVQYVTAKQGPILRKYQLYTIVVGTISSTINIPAIPEEEALSLRKEIANYAKLREVEEL